MIKRYDTLEPISLMEVERESLIYKEDRVNIDEIPSNKKDFRTILLLRYPKEKNKNSTLLNDFEIYFSP
jgi:hypothetical protein